jgi:anthranilate 1,2-dioxygenase ferredoxin reductase subunit
VTFRFETRPARIVRDCAGDVIIETSQGPLSADVVVAGIGILPNTELAEAAGLEVDNGIRVDAGCRTVDPDIFAAGEVTSHFNPRLGFHTRIESWQVAENQPAVAAANLLGGSETYADIPWLWSDQYTSNLQMLGLFGSETSTIVRGDVDSDSFCVFGLNADSQIVAVAAVNAGREIGPCRRLMMTNHPVDPATLANPAVAMRTLLNR